MKSTIRLFAFLLCGLADVCRAGDALAIGYNADGVWTAATYYSSGTSKGGADYKDEAGARAAALRDLELKKRPDEGMVKTAVLASSDKTGHVAYARGKTATGKDLHAAGYGPSQAEAEKRAFADLKQNGATKQLQVIYRYFSHGAEPGPAAAKPR